MAVINRFLCWNLRTSVLVGYGYVIITGVFSLVMRLIDLIATGTDFEISQGFQTPWRSHFWQAFLASDVVLTFDYVVMILFTAFMFLQVRERHFVMYMSAHRWYIIFFFIYQFVEICFSIFEFSYYGMNTFRLKYIVWTWLFWVFRTLVNGVFFVVLIARKQEMGEQMDMELRFAGERKRPGFGY